jgi:RNA polymerase sigma-70 factor (ECF subfamily)
LTALDDAEVVRELARKNHDALAVLFDRYQRLVFSSARGILKNDFEAEDVTQRVFFELHCRARQYGPLFGTVREWVLH